MTDAEVQRRLAEALTVLSGRSRSGLLDSWGRLRASAVLAAQAGLAAGLA